MTPSRCRSGLLTLVLLAAATLCCASARAGENASALGTPLPGVAVPALIPAGSGHTVLIDDALGSVLEVEESGRFEMGASAMFLVPRFESNLAFTAISIRPAVPGFAPIPSIGRTYQEFSYKLSASPRVWLGMKLNDDVGVRVTWWSYQQSATPKSVFNPPIPLGSPVGVNMIQSASPLMAISTTSLLSGVNSIQTQGVPGRPDRLGFTNTLGFRVWDFDATYLNLRAGRADLTLFGGLRYAYVTQTYAAFAQGQLPQSLFSDQSYSGLGPSGGIQALLPLAWEGLSLYGNGRIGFLFGEDRHTSRGQSLGHVPPFNLTANHDASSRQRFVPTFDLEFGLQWARALDMGGRFFTRAGVMAQGWPMGSGSSGNGNLGLLGFALSTGLDY